MNYKLGVWKQLFPLVCASFLWWVAYFLRFEDLFLSLYSLGVFAIVLWFFWMRKPDILWYLIGIFLACLLGLIYASYHFSHVEEKEHFFSRYDGVYISYRWEVHSLHKRSEFYDEYVMQLQALAHKEIVPEKSYHILRVPKNFTMYPGDSYEYMGTLRIPQDFNYFSYTRFLQAKNIYFRVSTNNLEKLSENTQTLSYRFFHFREYLLTRIHHLYTLDEWSFLAGVLFWAREGISQELQQNFNISWLTHFIAISGFHISLCIIFMSALVSFFPMYVRIVLMCLAIWGFAVFVGLWAPVVRAAIMGILGYIFLQKGSTVRNISLVAFTAVCMTLISPLSLLYDVGLQLSFLAVIGIIYTQSWYKKIFSFLPEILAIQSACVLTFSAFTFVFPLVFFQFWQISLLTPLANIAVSWTVPIIMISWALSLLVDAFIPWFTYIFSFPAWLLLKFDITMVNFFWTQSWAIIESNAWEYALYFQLIYLSVVLYILLYIHISWKLSR